MNEKEFDKKMANGEIEKVKEEKETIEPIEEERHFNPEDYEALLEEVRRNGNFFYDRGDPAAYDFTLANFTTDNNWHDLDLSAIVPSGAKAVAIQILIQDDALNSHIQFRKKGNTNVYNRSYLNTIVINLWHNLDIIVACDDNRVIEYRASNVVFTGINLTIKGWWKNPLK